MLCEGCVFPVIYILLQNKTEDSYERALRTILYLYPDLTPATMLCDFEKAFQNAFSSVFVGTQISGCFFHLAQCIWRKIQTLHLTQIYVSDERIRRHCKMLVALAFVPADDVCDVFESLQDVMPPELEELTNYFEDTWIGRPFRRRRRDAVFKPELWSVFDRVQGDLPKTNNSLEGWHRSLQLTLGHNHPTFYKFVEFLKLEQDNIEKRILRIRAGHDDARKNPKYQRTARAIKTLVNEYESRVDKLEYLQNISYLIELQK